MKTANDRLDLARLSLEGLSVGDAFGDRFFMHADTAKALIQARALPKDPWAFTDDTNMALSIYETLRVHQEIHQANLGNSFAKHYDPSRGYGPAMHRLLARIASGDPWKSVSEALFDGQGSFGNGAAMRVAPLGAYFFDDMDKVVAEAQKSAEITHAHPEGIAGAIAVAVADAVAVRYTEKAAPDRVAYLNEILPFVPDSEVRSGIARARDIRSRVVDHVIGMIGNSYRITAQDTVPFTLWCAGESLNSFEDAMWLTASALGDVDTNCAIVGGIVSLYVGQAGIPQEWIDKREPLPSWAFP
ncbi:ADP-ribosylglycohydrolase family protein [Phototrophicus methaneseepsis]|uniref:ADP-ribosylglycohydrolase family protein n=1 Tax=Phototrophicus methaneseepsis TaxID=2710758 RepID=A0A7S8E7F2_9CHLR|nr:ADP-ribosylglycohydrolase family protein [Phototrophicus methaneseepsis]QPC81724.1 ADP-ribosylglycohydrolase family protein [Phototrophicus methaneseepsis]